MFEHKRWILKSKPASPTRKRHVMTVTDGKSYVINRPKYVLACPYCSKDYFAMKLARFKMRQCPNCKHQVLPYIDDEIA